MERRSDSGIPVTAVVIVIVGLILLLQNFGVLPWAFWLHLVAYWPVVLILIGVRLVMGPTLLSSIVVSLILVAVVGFVAVLSVGDPERGLPFFARIDRFEQRVEAAIEGATSVNAIMDFGAGTLRLGTLPAGSDLLYAGNISGRGSFDRAVEFVRTDANGDISLRVALRSGGVTSVGGNEWDLQLSPEISWSITLNGGAGEIDLDLADLNVSDLTVNVGATDVKVRLPRDVALGTAAINTAAASIEITVPQGVAARIRSDSALSSLDVDERRFPRRDGVFISDNYDTAERKFDIRISSGVSSVTVR